MSTVAQRVAQAMDWRDMDQSALADAIGVTQGAISKIIVGKTANSRLLPKIAVALRVPLPWLLCKTDDPSLSAAELAITAEDREWLDLLHSMTALNRSAVLQLARTLAGGSSRVPVPDDPGDNVTVHSRRSEYRVG